MCDRCAELEERVAWLESELGLRVDADEIYVLQRAFGLAPGEAHLVRALYAARGRTLTHLQILDAIPSPGGLEDRSFTNINTLICRVRKGLGRDAIITVWGRGYQISPIGAERIRSVLNAARAANGAPMPTTTHQAELSQ